MPDGAQEECGIARVALESKGECIAGERHGTDHAVEQQIRGHLNEHVLRYLQLTRDDQNTRAAQDGKQITEYRDKSQQRISAESYPGAGQAHHIIQEMSDQLTLNLL